MRPRDIPRREWPEFLAGFARRHRSWLLSIEGAVVLSVTCTTEAAEPLGVTEAGESVHVDSEGAPEQANAID